MKKLTDLLSEVFDETPKVDRHSVIEGVKFNCIRDESAFKWCFLAYEKDYFINEMYEVQNPTQISLNAQIVSPLIYDDISLNGVKYVVMRLPYRNNETKLDDLTFIM